MEKMIVSTWLELEMTSALCSSALCWSAFVAVVKWNTAASQILPWYWVKLFETNSFAAAGRGFIKTQTVNNMLYIL